MNIRKKLTIARRKFLEANATKSGKNIGIKFKYFELSDIVPAATMIFDELGIYHQVEFDKDNGRAAMLIMDADADEVTEVLRFTIPYVEELPRFNKEGVMVTNPCQQSGSAQTYMRRYLYMIALDVVEHDEIEESLQKEQVQVEEAPAKKESKIPPTPTERKEIKEQVTEKKFADEEQIKELTKKLKELTKLDKTNKEFANEILIRTNGLKEVEINLYKDLCAKIDELIEECKKNA